MADDTGKSGPADGRRIDVSQKHELQYWTRELGVDAETLKATVNRVGPMVEKVRSELATRS
ncbi:MAG TPA: DUF3606 domain-containing protein [Myxococcota bacterium]|nr:DUF3606 domain-containing protein [Myxococcota bacterium]